ncbi:hypothetical protein 8014-B2_00101 [Lactobacillus phage ATCC 8014-B2]|uniref:Uncharacterized protein n=1 Tax=Lactobacillus phage ATCC 8014-B2 TaxID=1225795 RepID=K4I0K4_9CAUD|nr:hypothetical protein HOQ89_gp045 [Lactobacillus phage ATCC 8014-B2]AFU63168.1 hypothetical protein 8014-B2_00101 [Lactobacillus phage ATCC 8014-B2]
MYYSEFKEEVEALSSKYSVGGNDEFTVVFLHYSPVISIEKHVQYRVKITDSVKHFEKLPFSHKLYMIAAELAQTPVKERTERDMKLAFSERTINRQLSNMEHIARQARVNKHNAESPAKDTRPVNKRTTKLFIETYTNGATVDNKKEYTGIKDAKGNPINVGDTVVEVFNFKNIPNMPDFEEKGEPFVVKKDCYLYSHWIARGVSEGSKFGVDGLCFGNELLKKGDNDED